MKTKIYPKFKELADIYELSNQYLQRIQEVKLFYAQIPLKEMPRVSQVEEHSQLLNGNSFSLNSNLELVTSLTDPNYYSLTLEYMGYCPVTLVDANKFVYADISHGVVKEKSTSKYFGFKSLSEATDYFKNKATYDEEIKKLMESYPSIFFFLFP